MMDLVLTRFAEEDRLGVVYAAEPRLHGWDDNREIATDLANRMGLPVPLPDAFDFPIGAMLWFRPAALRPLIDLRLDWGDYPPEPVPIDGTIMHAIERLPSIIARHVNFTTAVTHTPGVMW